MHEEDFSSPNDEVIASMMIGLIKASNHQQKMAIELTKLVVEKSAETMNEEKVFLSFKRASKVVGENFPLNVFMINFVLISIILKIRIAVNLHITIQIGKTACIKG